MNHFENLQVQCEGGNKNNHTSIHMSNLTFTSIGYVIRTPVYHLIALITTYFNIIRYLRL